MDPQENLLIATFTNVEPFVHYLLEEYYEIFPAYFPNCPNDFSQSDMQEYAYTEMWSNWRMWDGANVTDVYNKLKNLRPQHID